MGAVPTQKQYDLMRVLGNGCILVVGKRRQIEPLLRRGWATAHDDFCWVRLTSDGVRALAAAVDKYGWPEIAPRRKQRTAA